MVISELFYSYNLSLYVFYFLIYYDFSVISSHYYVINGLENKGLPNQKSKSKLLRLFAFSISFSTYISLLPEFSLVISFIESHNVYEFLVEKVCLTYKLCCSRASFSFL